CPRDRAAADQAARGARDLAQSAARESFLRAADPRDGGGPSAGRPLRRRPQPRRPPRPRRPIELVVGRGAPVEARRPGRGATRGGGLGAAWGPPCGDGVTVWSGG